MNNLLFGMISTRHSLAYTSLALSSFFQYTADEHVGHFALIDNDGSLDTSILDPYEKVTLDRNNTPQSFARNANNLIEQASKTNSDLILLNNDIVFADGWLVPLMDERSAIYSSVCNMQFDYQTKAMHLRLSMNLEDYIGKERDFEEIARVHRSRNSGYQLTHSAPYYCVRIPYEVYSTVGRFEEGYGMASYEDTDYTLRCYQRGFPLYFALESFILHFYGRSTWNADCTAEEKELKDQGAKQAELRFQDRWGKRLTELFGKHDPSSMAWLKLQEEQAMIQLLKAIALGKLS